jgi:three-Cys-motif partner protein
VPEKRYDWRNGPAEIQQHSIAKHNVLRSYLAAYFQTLVTAPGQEEFRLTLVDAFAGGGLYVHKDTRELVKGSPSIFLQSTREAEYLINKDRRTPIRFDVDYFFIDEDRHACAHLEKVLREDGYGDELGKRIQLRHARFQDQAGDIIEYIRRKSPRNGRSIFSLDQYGYKEAPTDLIRKIFENLPRAEVILTFAVDSFLNFAATGAITEDLLVGMGLPDVLRGRSLEEIKDSSRDWRLLIQSSMYRSIVARSGAKHYTPFFVRNKKGHGDYWLIHMSQHHRARDVMTEVHWSNNNYFIHYGGAGLDMFQMIGYDPHADSGFTGQSNLGFEFDDVARKASIAVLNEQIPRRIYAHDDGVSFGELFVATCNDSPASAQIYRDSIGHLIDQGIVEVVSVNSVTRRSGQAIEATDQIMPPRQRRLFSS